MKPTKKLTMEKKDLTSEKKPAKKISMIPSDKNHQSSSSLRRERSEKSMNENTKEKNNRPTVKERLN